MYALTTGEVPSAAAFLGSDLCIHSTTLSLVVPSYLHIGHHHMSLRDLPAPHREYLSCPGPCTRMLMWTLTDEQLGSSCWVIGSCHTQRIASAGQRRETMATEEHPLRLHSKLRDDDEPAPRVSKGGWVKVGAVATGERFWCSVLTLSADGKLTASADNHLLLSTVKHSHMSFAIWGCTGLP